MIVDEYKLALDQVNKLAERRQATTATYISVNTALAGAMAFLFKDSQLSGILFQTSVLILLFSGIVACSLWRRLIKYYSALTRWWYEQIRSLESQQPESNKLIIKEYQKLYLKQKSKNDTKITPYELNLTWLFTAIYLVFGLVIIVAIVLRLI